MTGVLSNVYHFKFALNEIYFTVYIVILNIVNIVIYISSLGLLRMLCIENVRIDKTDSVTVYPRLLGGRSSRSSAAVTSLSEVIETNFRTLGVVGVRGKRLRPPCWGLSSVVVMLRGDALRVSPLPFALEALDALFSCVLTVRTFLGISLVGPELSTILPRALDWLVPGLMLTFAVAEGNAFGDIGGVSTFLKDPSLGAAHVWLNDGTGVVDPRVWFVCDDIGLDGVSDMPEPCLDLDLNRDGEFSEASSAPFLEDMKEKTVEGFGRNQLRFW